MLATHQVYWTLDAISSYLRASGFEVVNHYADTLTVHQYWLNSLASADWLTACNKSFNEQRFTLKWPVPRDFAARAIVLAGVYGQPMLPMRHSSPLKFALYVPPITEEGRPKLILYDDAWEAWVDAIESRDDGYSPTIFPVLSHSPIA